MCVNYELVYYKTYDFNENTLNETFSNTHNFDAFDECFFTRNER